MQIAALYHALIFPSELVSRVQRRKLYIPRFRYRLLQCRYNSVCAYKHLFRVGPVKNDIGRGRGRCTLP